MGRGHERSDEADGAVAQAVEDAVQYVAANDLGVATKIVAILQAGAVSKSLFPTPAAAKAG